MEPDMRLGLTTLGSCIEPKSRVRLNRISHPGVPGNKVKYCYQSKARIAPNTNKKTTEQYSP